MRIDRFATLHVFHPLAVRESGPRRVPILMYHSISDANETRHPYFRTSTSATMFETQMRFLSENRYQSVGLGVALDVLEGRRADLVKPVVITFDDGFRDFRSRAFPVLAACGHIATMFLPTGHIEDHPSQLKGIETLTWSEISELEREGIEFGSHTVTHPQLRTLPPVKVDEELRQSKRTIEDRLGKPVKYFSYPYAFPENARSFVGRLRETLAACGYLAGVSTMIGTATQGEDPFFLRRLPANSSDDILLFRAKLERGYDWLHTLQRWKKSLLPSAAV